MQGNISSREEAFSPIRLATDITFNNEQTKPMLNFADYLQTGKDLKTYNSKGRVPSEMTEKRILGAHGATLCYDSPAIKNKTNKNSI